MRIEITEDPRGGYLLQIDDMSADGLTLDEALGSVASALVLHAQLQRPLFVRTAIERAAYDRQRARMRADRDLVTDGGPA